MNNTKEITIELWQKDTEIVVIGKWYPPIPDDTDEQTPSEPPLSEPDKYGVQKVTIPQEMTAPYIIMNTMIFTPRPEVLGGNPIARGQSIIPKKTIEAATRNMSYMFANEISMFQPVTKAIGAAWLNRKLFNHSLVKTIPMTVCPIQGSETMEQLRLFIEQYSTEEQKKIKVINNIETVEEANSKPTKKYIFGDKETDYDYYITVTKLDKIYEVKNPYINTSQLPDEIPLVPGSEEIPAVKNMVKKLDEAKESDKVEMDLLRIYDDMKEAEPNSEPTREDVLKALLLEKSMQQKDEVKEEAEIDISFEETPEDLESEYEKLMREQQRGE